MHQNKKNDEKGRTVYHLTRIDLSGSAGEVQVLYRYKKKKRCQRPF